MTPCPSCLQPVCRCHPVALKLREFCELYKHSVTTLIPIVFVEQAATLIDELTARVDTLEKEISGKDGWKDTCKRIDKENAYWQKELTTAQERIKEDEVVIRLRDGEIEELGKVIASLQSALTKCQGEVKGWKELFESMQDKKNALEALADRLLEEAKHPCSERCVAMAEGSKEYCHCGAKNWNLHLQQIREGKA